MKTYKVSDMGWQLSGACHPANRPPNIRAEWFMPVSHTGRRSPEEEQTVARALALCRTCKVRERCERWANEDPHAAGVWGGKYHTAKH